MIYFHMQPNRLGFCRKNSQSCLRPPRLNCKYIFRGRGFARHPLSHPAWVKSQQSNKVLAAFCSSCCVLHNPSLSAWWGKPSTLHFIKNTADDRMETYPIWELKNASARLLHSASSRALPPYTLSILRTERQNAAPLGTVYECVLRPPEPCGGNRKWQDNSTVMEPRSCSKSKH